MIEQIATVLGDQPLYFWRTQQGAELDLFTQLGGRNYGIEVKRSSAPAMTRSIRIALDDLQLEHVAIAYPGTRRYRVDSRVSVVPFTELTDLTTSSEFVSVITAR